MFNLNVLNNPKSKSITKPANPFVFSSLLSNVNKNTPSPFGTVKKIDKNKVLMI